jgi:hypothetical protein
MTASLESQLRRYGAYLDEADGAGELRPPLRHPDREPTRSARLVLVGALALFVVVVVGLVVRAAVEEGAPVTSHPDSEWVRLPDAPLSPRSNAAIGWTGEEILVFGGSTYLCPPGADCDFFSEPPFRDGAAYDPDSDRWRSIASTPIPVEGAQAIALNGEAYALVEPWPLGQTGGPQQLLRYVPSEDRWHSYELPRAAVSDIVATDDSIALLATEGGLEFHPDDESWSDLPVDPIGASVDRYLVWADHSLVLVAKPPRDLTNLAEPGLVRTARLEAGRWVEMPADGPYWAGPPIAHGDRITVPLLGCSDGGEQNSFRRCIAWGGVLDLTTSSWSELPNPPPIRNQVGDGSSGATTSEQLLLISLQGWVLDLRTDTWIQVPPIDDLPSDITVERSFAGAGPYGFAFGGSRFTRISPPVGELLNEAWIWKPSTS